MTPSREEPAARVPAKRSKYRNVRTEVDGIKFASKAEARRYGQLQLLVKAGEIRDLELQRKYDLPGGVKYVADFDYIDARTGLPITEDVKGVLTPVFKLKAKQFAAIYHRPIQIVRPT